MKKDHIVMLSIVSLMLLTSYSTMAQPLMGGPLEGLTRLKAGETMRESSSDPDWRDGNADCRYIPPGMTLTIADLEGPGVINQIWNTIAAEEPGYSRLVVIRMYWDGEEYPSVEAPIGDFFVIGHGIDHPMQSLAVVVSAEGRARNCYWPMPFAKSARITITNESRKPVNAFYYYVNWQKLPELPPDTAYFHAMYRQDYPTIEGQDYLIADIEGRGHYVGTVMNIRQLTGGWYGEGDDFWYIDGETEPRLRGTGSEDYFCDAWGFRQFDGPYYGVPVWSHYKPLGKITAYRWHLTDPVSFHQSLRLEIEHKGAAFNEDGTVRSGYEERTDDFSSVAFWYQIEPHKPFPPLPDAYDRLYFNPGDIVQAETLMDTVEVSSGPFEQQDGVGSGAGQLFWRPEDAGQKLDLAFEVPEDGEYDLVLMLTQSWDYGIYVPHLNDKPLGDSVDQYSANIKTAEAEYRTPLLSAGKHTLSFVNKGKNSESDGYYFGLDALSIAPVKKR